MKSQWATEKERDAEELIAAGDIDEAIKLCEILAEYFYGEEKGCDEAGDYAEGMRASRSAGAWSARARELRRSRESA